MLDLAGELFAVARLLDAQPSLRRALSDPSGKPDDRAALVGRLFQGKVSPSRSTCWRPSRGSDGRVRRTSSTR